jgi:PPK2 family polyphosphate:nucleotide phosphotransferase
MGSKKKTHQPSAPTEAVTDLLRLPGGTVDLATFNPRATPGFPGSKADAPGLTEALAPELGDLQERLYAAGRVEPKTAPKVLMILQGMDTSGKGGAIRHAIGLVDPQGVMIKAFRAPTAVERRHPYLWRVERELPPPGFVGIFDRSHYEEVLVARVNRLVAKAVWSKRYQEINEWEARLVAAGTVMIKCFLHISADEQRSRLQARLEDPAKHWKYNPGDVDERVKWPLYAAAYAEALRRCHTEAAPWFVIPSDRKWYRNWAVAQLLTEHLRALGLSWPEATFDVEHESARVAAS